MIHTFVNSRDSRKKFDELANSEMYASKDICVRVCEENEMLSNTVFISSKSEIKLSDVDIA